MQRSRRCLSALFFGLVAVSACNDANDAAPLGGECSSGPEYSAASEFPSGPASSSAPECTRHCGEHEELQWGAGGTGPSVSAVPSGTCRQEGARCQMRAVRACPELPSKGVMLQFECSCASGEWRCAAAYFGGGACATIPNLDAGADG